MWKYSKCIKTTKSTMYVAWMNRHPVWFILYSLVAVYYRRLGNFRMNFFRGRNIRVFNFRRAAKN